MLHEWYTDTITSTGTYLQRYYVKIGIVPGDDRLRRYTPMSSRTSLQTREYWGKITFFLQNLHFSGQSNFFWENNGLIIQFVDDHNFILGNHLIFNRIGAYICRLSKLGISRASSRTQW